MFARMFRIRASADRLDEGLRVLRESTDQVHALTGFRHSYHVLDARMGVPVSAVVATWVVDRPLPRAPGRLGDRAFLLPAVCACVADLIADEDVVGVQPVADLGEPKRRREVAREGRGPRAQNDVADHEVDLVNQAVR